ncbi:MAG: restriction endonuclease subunit S [Symbiobacterium sp.]|uniref:restriction endonuclease subunit S n=1 Tax=Symbiobacterium sp. TaxID=1971213 RepID=UPI003463BFD4
MRGWRRTRLGDCCQIVSGGTPRTNCPDYWDGDIPWATPKDLSELSGPYITDTQRKITRAGLDSCAAEILPPGSVLFSSRAPIGYVAINTVPMATNQGFKSLVPDPKQVDSKFLYHWLRRNRLYLESLGRGATFKEISKEVMAAVEIYLPPLDQQRRIAEVLDRAEALINSRRKSLTTLDGLIRTLFVDSFGDIAINTRRWPTIRLQELLTAPPRNGVSPAKGGTANYNVLTLSAITGSEFDVTAVKNGSFVSIPGPQYMVDENDFLICRGNGNLDLVGRGHFPPYSMPGVIFPDTMIAIRLSADLVDKVFFEQMWNSPLVRHQIELLARTTNGTYKINQTMLADITLVVPPIERQRKFGEQVSTIQQLKSKYRTSLVQFEALYASLQHRAFKGEL